MTAPEGGAAPLTVAGRLSTYLRGGGIITPIITVLLAFFVGGLVVLFTGHNPLDTYKAIWEGTGLNWPWLKLTGSEDAIIAELNLQQTLIATTPLILTGLAVAFAFRCGLFNIGGQGQFLVGTFVAVWIGSSFADMPAFLHVVLAMLGAMAAGAAWGGIAGLLRATTGANEVISTIMLNWIAIWIGVFLFGLGGPLQSTTDTDKPVSNDIVEGAKLPVWWGDPELQGLHIGLFIALAFALVFWVILNRTRTGFEVRAVGFNPEAARSAGISVGRNYVLVMAICGLFAGLAGSLEILGWQFRLATNSIQISDVGFVGIAVALLGRNTAIGTVFAALLFGALTTGTSVRNLDPEVFEPALAKNLTLIIQGLVVLFVSADILVVYIWSIRRKLRRKPATPQDAPVAA
ncbi:MAG TPA: ABC transporter permease [Solirubrobacteraceae bacterium]|nr:ABC transporter permease [Solirubrobacteraceae bacterium]